MCIPLEKLHNLFPNMLCYSPYITHDAPTRDGNKKKWSRVCAKKTNGRQPPKARVAPVTLVFIPYCYILGIYK